MISKSSLNNLDKIHRCKPSRLTQKCSRMSVQISHLCTSFLFTVLFICLVSKPSSQQQNPFCPKNCTCDEQSLEILCKEPIGTYGIPHTLHPGTTKIVINNAQTTQLIGLEFFIQLEYLDLARNRLSSVDFKEFTKTTALKFLNTSHNSIVDLKDSSVITALYSSQSTMPTLSSRDTELPDPEILRRLTKISITTFILDHNSIRTISNLTFIRWHRLQRLDLSYNAIDSIDSLSFAGLGKLEYLNLRGNRLKQVPTIALHNTIISINQFGPDHSRAPSLKTLDLGENYLHILEDESLSQLVKLHELHLDSCSIYSIREKAFSGLDSINSLILDKNNLNEIPVQSFTHLKKLRILKLNSNPLETLQPHAFSYLTHLEELEINHGSFKELLSKVFDGLYNLKLLQISYNHNLTSIQPATFDKLERLRYLNLQSNSLRNLPDDLNDKSLELLDLRNNTLNCDCDLKWLTRWLRESSEAMKTNHKNSLNSTDIGQHNSQQMRGSAMRDLMNEDYLDLVCAGPPALSGRKIQELPDNKLECLEPESYVNVHIGFGLLFTVALIMTLVCLANFCHDRKHLVTTIKENFVQNQISLMLPYQNNLQKDVDDLGKETQLYGPEYETIYDGNQAQNYNGQVIYCGPQHPYYSQHI